MRKQKKIVVWPVYFDSSKTRSGGRKVAKSVAVPNPNLTELQEAAENLRLEPEMKANVSHPAFPWRKTGLMLLNKSGTKMQTLTKLAVEIGAVRRRAEE